ncbi:CpsD/CapB family tyrosine-protein kinase [Salipiger abyssi]|uniref:CpsD/CapB family tyrosine-protein kinase n=1 Tax=Salipiger abyssi TaxID=1250539 RepID=UPI001A8ED1D2|nr:CpsD/CapB family tyrosine-protein kinase [Salipiger abyssi]MBN9886027.1 exopolysaccharide biosynthesis protein [Salipiger abyssi]
MNMVDRRKFRRKFGRSEEAAPEVQPEDPPIEPLESRETRLARRKAETEAAAAAEEAARKAQEDEARRKAEAARKAEDARRAAERLEAVQRQRAEAARRKREAEEQARKQAEDAAREAELRAQQEADAARAVEAARQEDEARRAAIAERREERRKAREEARRRSQEETAPATAAAPEPQTEPKPAPQATPLWDALPTFSVDARHLERNRIVTAGRQDPAHAAFDVLRTRLLQALSDNGWKRVAITSPTKDCGKTFTAANLAISLSRQETCRTLLLDCDLRRPSLHKVMGLRNPGSMGDMLRGLVPPERQLARLGPNDIHAGQNIAFGFNGTVEPYASELLQDPRTEETLNAIEKSLAPDVILFDLPPALYFDDVMAFRPQFDGVLLVVGGGLTTDKEVREVERRLGENTPLLGTVLNKAEGTNLRKYSY